MDDGSNQDRAIELLQQLGLKEYEARCFVALTRQQSGTAKEVSETSEVPRTRVYDAIRVLESKGLVEVQHSNPQVFRAVSIDEATQILQSTYTERIDSLRSTLDGLNPVEEPAVEGSTQEVWSLSDGQGITARTAQLLEGATDEIVLVIGHESIFTDQLVELLQAAQQRDVSLTIGTVDEELRSAAQDALPEAEVFVSGLDWLQQSRLAGDETEISRLVLVDREAILVSSFRTGAGKKREHEQAVFGRGFNNGLVTIVRRLLATGLLPADDPGAEQG